MAYEKMDRAFPCQCGKGTLIAEWEEHDVYPSGNRHIEWRFECPECADAYTFCEEHIVRKADAEKRRAMSARQAIARGAATQIAAQRYEQQWVEHVLSLPNKAAMHRAVACGGYGKFLKRAKSKEWKKWLEGEARSRFHASPEDCLLQLGILDVEVNESIAVADDAVTGRTSDWISIDKKRLPFF